VAVTTVADFAEVLKVPVDRLLHQLRQTGFEHNSPTDAITDDQKLELLVYLRHRAGAAKPLPKLARGVTTKADAAKPTSKREGGSEGGTGPTNTLSALLSHTPGMTKVI